MGTHRLILVNTADLLNKFWPQVREGLEIIQRKNPEPWLPEDVYVALKGGNSVLLITLDEQDKLLSILVLTIENVWDGKNCHVWCFWNRGGESVFSHWEQVKDFIKAAGCRRITMNTKRKGYGKRLNGLGFNQTSINYELNF